MGKKNTQISGFAGRTIGNMIQRSTGAKQQAAPQPKKGNKK